MQLIIHFINLFADKIFSNVIKVPILEFLSCNTYIKFVITEVAYMELWHFENTYNLVCKTIK